MRLVVGRYAIRQARDTIETKGGERWEGIGGNSFCHKTYLYGGTGPIDREKPGKELVERNPPIKSGAPSREKISTEEGK